MAEVMQVAVPDIGDFSDVPVIEVLVAPGDSVAPEDPLLTLESDKATMDVPAPAGGVVGELLVSVGDKVSEGTPILTLTADADEGATAEPAAPGAVETAVEAEDEARPDETPTPEVASDGAGSAGPVYASPSVRRLARERGIDLSTIAGTGRKGRITKEDLDRPAAAPAPSPAPAAAPAFDGLPAWPQVDFAAFGPIERYGIDPDTEAPWRT